VVVFHADLDEVAGLELAGQDFLRQRVLDLLLDRTLERPRTIHRIEAGVSQFVARLVGQVDAHVALCQAIVVKLYKLQQRNIGFRIYRRALIEENKWRAARWGLDGKLIDFGKKTEVPMRDLALELLEFVDDVVDELGSREAVNDVHRVLAEGTSADRQLAVYQATHDTRAVVRHLVERGALGLMTTHDLALAAICDDIGPRASNVHFADHVEGGRMQFDYRLHEGVVTKSNALELMRSVGLSV